MELTRRQLLLRTLFGAGGLGLRSLATGIPAAFLARPRAAQASGHRSPLQRTAAAPQYVIFNSSEQGDPINTNVPGCYLSPQLGHPPDPRMSPAQLTLSGAPFTAALPWTQLPQTLLDRTCFFHHGTYTVVHADEASILGLGGFTTNNAMYPAQLAAQLAPLLGTIQDAPVVLGPRATAEDIYYAGAPQPILSPSALSTLLAPPTGPLGQLQQLRDQSLDRLNALVKAEGNPFKSKFIDQYALSQTQVRALSESLLTMLTSIEDDSASSQVVAAAVLLRMNVAPLVSVNIPFGGDNHSDPGLGAETTQTLSGVATIGTLWSALQDLGIQNQVSFLSLNVFGRTLSTATSGNGRGHNADHHVALLIGAPFAGGVIGGIEPSGDDFGAMSLSSATGAGVPGGGGDISKAETMQSMAKTFGTGVGVDPGFLATNITGGKTVDAALSR